MGFALPRKYPTRGIVAGQRGYPFTSTGWEEENQKSSLEALTSCRDRVIDIDPSGACPRSHRAQPMPAHHQPHRSRGEHAAVSSRRRKCRTPSLTLRPVRYVTLDQAHEAAAIAALADLLAPYLIRSVEEDAA
jgi:hypothetical protein